MNKPKRIGDSELIINNRGAIYHLNVRPDELAQTVITVGDPHRVKLVSRHFDSIEVNHQHREFITHTGYCGKKRISVVSTGIGPDNIDIVLNELDALVNIDFEEKVPNPELRSLNIIRIGTSGSLQPDIPVDAVVASTHGIGLDNLMHFYREEHDDFENTLLKAFVQHTRLDSHLSYPYIYTGDSSLTSALAKDHLKGITVTCPGFYGPQGRVLRLGLAQPELVDLMTTFNHKNLRVTNFEMETAAIYGLGKAMGHRCLSLSSIVANRVNKTFSSHAEKSMENLIVNTLQAITESDL